jgi:acetyltransferase-like isoleucine patch superfamily enzyme
VLSLTHLAPARARRELLNSEVAGIVLDYPTNGHVIIYYCSQLSLQSKSQVLEHVFLRCPSHIMEIAEAPSFDETAADL